MSVNCSVDEGGLAELVVSSPPVNAFSIRDLQNLVEALDALAADTTVRAVVLRAEGRGFCGGGDVKEVQALPGFEGILGQAHGSLEASLAIAESPVPVVAAVHGYCIGVGVLLVGSCDIVVCGERCRFVLAEADNGATSGVVQALRLLPEKRMRAAMFTCEPFYAEELHAYGSVYRIAPEESVAAEARGLAAAVAVKNPRVVRGLKRSMDGTVGRDLRQLYRAELSYTLELNMLGDARDARATFLDGSRAGYLEESDTRASG